ncbi:hypothetical protein GGS23DRAFT_595124 [Durotheca rogersii]|uniref:uncharacterized protein n=1 Tax=Durotheca rogersii TaxID=419775 RepID=UPI0022201C1A|nr:uncharacterized protein GGS23DRAFT_595124 [Durotheca rogersii]KAI5865606.1 hypothetical protein GGS23DRAFT_595124 [Durotheca rogersii]
MRPSDALDDDDPEPGRKRPRFSLGRVVENTFGWTPSDQKPREEKSAPYRDPRYKILLETEGSFMGKSDLGISDASKIICRTLLESEQTVPKDSVT